MLERSRRIAGRGRKIGHPLNSTDEGSAGRGRRTGYGVGKIVVSIWRMIDTVLAAAASAPFQTADLRHQPIMARQDNLAAVEGLATIERPCRHTAEQRDEIASSH